MRLLRAHVPLLVVGLLVLYGSLWPFRFARPYSHELVLRAVLARTTWWTSPGDVAGNVLLFVPMGIAIVFAARRLSFGAMGVCGYCTLAVAFAALVQLLQIYVPGRDANFADVLWNAVGTGIGLVGGLLVSRQLPRIAHSADPHAPLAVSVVLLWLGAVLWPFVPTLDFQQIKDSLKPLLLHGTWQPASFARYLVDFVLVACTVGAWRRSHLTLIALVAVALASRPFLVGQTLSVATVAAAALGVPLGIVLQRLALQKIGGLVVVGAMLWFAIDAMRPFEFGETPRPFQWLPFAAMLRGAMDINLASLCHAAFFSGALMLIAGRLQWRIGLISVILCAWFFVFEYLQRWIPTRTGDITIALLPLGWWLALKFLRRTHP